MSDISNIFNHLEGLWIINRKIINFGKTDSRGCFKKINKNMLYYEETGILTLNSGKTFNSFNEYFYIYQNKSIHVFFAKNKKIKNLFHIIEFENLITDKSIIIAKGYHLCKYDMYSIKYHFCSANLFNITYSVKGPSKDYESNSFFIRA